jgi:F420-non-reducing hydrogenase small subunit
LEFVHIPVLADHKYHGQTGEGDPHVIEIPEADVGIISGGVRNEKEKQVALEMRKKCKTLIALGACASTGGIPALANMYPLDDLYKKVYKESQSTEPADTPKENLPPLLDRVYAVDEVVDKVDVYIPGCAPNPAMIADALTCLLEGKPFVTPEKSVCDDCPVKREKKAEIDLKRPLEDADFKQGEPWENTRCFNEQGVLCLGPVTKSGCSVVYEEGGPKVPRCIYGYMPCRGCFGPIRKGAKPLVEMMGALSSIGLNAKQIDDRRALLNRYVGAHNNLRPLPARPGVR